MNDYRHRCTTAECPYLGKLTDNLSCGCHRKEAEIMKAELERLNARVAELTAGAPPDAWQRRQKDRYGKWQDWVECSGDPKDQQRWRNVGCEIRPLYALTSTQRERTVPYEDCLNCRCRPDEQCAGVSSTERPAARPPMPEVPDATPPTTS